MSGVILRLPSPHDAVAQAFREAQRSGNELHWRARMRLEELGCYRSLTKEYTKPPVPWVAVIKGKDREFVRGSATYPDSVSVGEDDVWIEYFLEPGKLYEINEVIPRNLSRKLVRLVSVRRYRAKVIKGALVEES
jgi:hypothetical protein